MRANRGGWLKEASPGALFLYGGEDMQPVYPQPELGGQDDWRYSSPYDRGAAAIDHMHYCGTLNRLGLHGIIAIRDRLVAEISREIPAAVQIEADRQRLSHAINQYYRRRAVDHQG